MHSIQDLAHSLKDNSNLPDILRNNLTTLATTLNTNDADNKHNITTSTFHQDSAPITSSAQALDLLTFASHKMDTVVTPNYTDDMSESDRINESVRAQEASQALKTVKDTIGFISCSSYNPDGSCTVSGDGII